MQPKLKNLIEECCPQGLDASSVARWRESLRPFLNRVLTSPDRERAYDDFEELHRGRSTEDAARRATRIVRSVLAAL